MKYSVPETIEFVGWTIFATAIALLMAQAEVLQPSFTTIPAGWGTAIYIIVALAIGFVGTLYIEKLPKVILYPLCVIGILTWIYSIAHLAVKSFELLNVHVADWIAVIILGGMLGIAVLLFRKKKHLRVATVLNNFVFIFFFGVLAAMLGVRLTPFITVILLLIIACYDAFAVWKAETMQKMAMNLVKLGVVPGVSVFVYKEKRVGLLGGGDIFFIGLASIVMMSQTNYGLGAMIGMWCAIAWIFIAAKPEYFYPAIPFIAAGLLWGMLWQAMFLGTTNPSSLFVNIVGLICLNLLFIVGVQYFLGWISKKGYGKKPVEEKNGKENKEKKVSGKINA